MKRNIALILLGVLIILFSGCSGPQEEPKTPEQIANEEYDIFEKEAIEVAKEFVLATQGDKEKIKELSFPSLLDYIEEKNWSVMLVDEIELKTDTFEITTEQLGPKQVLVRLFYEGEMTTEDETMPVKLSSKLGVVEHDGRPVVFSIN